MAAQKVFFMKLVKRATAKFKRTLNDLTFDVAGTSLGIRNPKRNIILMYHGIDTAGNNPFNTRHTSLKFFEKQISFLTKNYTVVSLKDYFEQHHTASNLCAVTFDDGYLNNYTNAVPLLEKYNCPATLFITGLNETHLDILWADYVNIAGKLLHTVTIDGEIFSSVNGMLVSNDRKKNILEIAKHLNPELEYKFKIYEALDNALNFKAENLHVEYWKLMTDEQIKKVSKNNLFEIGSHGYYHNNLGNIKKENAFEEITKSKKYLENLIQKSITTLGYPDGSYAKHTIDFASQLGFVHQTCSDGYINPHDAQEKYLLDRNGIYNCDSAANQLIAALNN